MIRRLWAWLFSTGDMLAVKRAKQRARDFEKNWRLTAHMADARFDKPNPEPPIMKLDV